MEFVPGDAGPDLFDDGLLDVQDNLVDTLLLVRERAVGGNGSLDVCRVVVDLGSRVEVDQVPWPDPGVALPGCLLFASTLPFQGLVQVTRHGYAGVEPEAGAVEPIHIVHRLHDLQGREVGPGHLHALREAYPGDLDGPAEVLHCEVVQHHPHGINEVACVSDHEFRRRLA